MLKAITQWMRRAAGGPTPIPEPLWRDTLAHYPFLARLPADEATRLRRLAEHFIDRKQFTGAHGLEVTDAMAVAVAAQACLPLLHWGRADAPETALAWYDDFVGIVLTPGEVKARRTWVDEAGLVHEYDEVLVGEAAEDGPVLLSWHDVRAGGERAAEGYNVVIHEFMHKIDMRGGAPDGCPPLPPGFHGTRSARAARAAWLAVIEPAWARFREQVILAERFGQPAPWLDAYGASDLSEFFPVACEAWFVQRARFAADWPELDALLADYFGPPPLSPR